MKKCLIVGSSGLVGACLVNELQESWEVFGISRRNFDTGHRNYRHIPLHLGKDWDTGLFPDKVDAVIHLAQSDHYREFPEHTEDVFTVNTLSTLKLLDYARRAGAKTFVLASSGGLDKYRLQNFTLDKPPTSEENLSFYLGTKLCSEILANSYSSFLNVVLLRFYFVYGPGQKRDRLIPRLVQSVMEGQPITLQGNDGIRINPIHVSDAVSAICHSLDLNENCAINIAGPEILSLRQIGEMIGATVGREPEFNIQATDEIPRLDGDIKKMTKLLGPPRVKFQEGVKSYIEDSPLKIAR